MIDTILPVLKSTTLAETTFLLGLLWICLIPFFAQKDVEGNVIFDEVTKKPIKLSVLGLVFREIGRTQNRELSQQLKDTKKYFEESIINNNVDLKYEIDRVSKTTDEKIEHVLRKLEKYREAGEIRSNRNKADSYHDDILLQADKLNAGKPFSDERFKQLYRKVLWYEEYCKNNKDYKNGVCIEACRYIKEQYKERYYGGKDQ